MRQQAHLPYGGSAYTYVIWDEKATAGNSEGIRMHSRSTRLSWHEVLMHNNHRFPSAPELHFFPTLWLLVVSISRWNYSVIQWTLLSMLVTRFLVRGGKYTTHFLLPVAIWFGNGVSISRSVSTAQMLNESLADWTWQAHKGHKEWRIAYEQARHVGSKVDRNAREWYVDGFRKSIGETSWGGRIVISREKLGRLFYAGTCSFLPKCQNFWTFLYSLTRD